MRCDRNLDEMRSNFVLLTGDRRLEPRRACRASVWLLDDDLARVVEFGAALEISREGVTFEVPRDSGLRVVASGVRLGPFHGPDKVIRRATRLLPADGKD